MRICFVHEEYPNETNFGGIATYQKIVAEYFANNGKDSVIVIARGKKDQDYYENNVHVYRIGEENDSNSIDSVKEYRKKIAELLKKLQNENKIDIIETPDWGASTIYFEQYRKVPLVVRLHTPLKIWLKYNNNDFGHSKKLILNWENKMLNKANLLTSCSSLLKKMVKKDYKLNKEIIVIPNPCNEKDFYYSNTKDNNNCIYVGSLEERKGVLILAESINNTISKLPKDVLFYFLGKDTKRNNKNISTKEYILSIISKQYHDRIIFLGQKDNSEVKQYLNLSKLAIFPSLFDNYPYVVLEAMLCGKHIILSDNIGLVDLVKNNNYVFKSNSKKDLSEKILLFYSQKRSLINKNNIDIVKKECNVKLVCDDMRLLYLDVIKKYQLDKENKNVLKVVNKHFSHITIKKILKLENNLANEIYILTTNLGKLVVKKYNYNYDFNLCNKLYSIYEDNNIDIIRPINNKVINMNKTKYNIFNYIKPSEFTLDDDFIIKMTLIKRRVKNKATLLDKCDKYYNYLNKLKSYKIKKVPEILEIYKEVRSNNIFKEQYINHGDLSYKNIICNKNKKYIIDFDEATVTTELYDFAVMVVKLKAKDNKLLLDDIRAIIKSISKVREKYSLKDYKDSIIIYLCKILIEKFYLYENNSIDLFSSSQQTDDYRRYISLLKDAERL